MEFPARKIVEFYKNTGRTFPWRVQRTPFNVFVAEYMLVRTRADNVVNPYINFISEYPSLEALIPGERLKQNCVDAFSSLGLKRRAMSFYRCLEKLVELGRVPHEEDIIEELPYVGQYIRAAIRVFGFGIKDTIIDANVVRIIARFYGIEIKDSLRRDGRFTELVRSSVPDESFVDYSYGLIDFAAAVCRKPPLCDSCPLCTECRSVKNENIEYSNRYL